MVIADPVTSALTTTVTGKLFIEQSFVYTKTTYIQGEKNIKINDAFHPILTFP